MGRRSLIIPVLAGLLVQCVAASSSASLITYRTRSANRDIVMVMDDTGANSTEIYRSPKFGGAGSIAISPQGPDGTWVAIEVYEGLFKFRADGTETIKVLCGQGTDANGAAYGFIGRQQWSPDGTEILIQTGNSLALISADFEVGPDCDSPLEPIFDYEWDEDGWALEGTAAWNDDGSMIAFFEFLHPREEFGDVRLVILERQGTAWTVHHTVDASHIDYFDGYPNDLDWQRGGDLLAFWTREWTGPHQSAPSLNSIDAVTGAWEILVEGTSPSWSPDGSELIFTDPSGDLVRWTHPNGPGQSLGTGELPDWQRGPATTCGDGTCTGQEDSCTCPEDCDFAPITEVLCTDGIDNDCDTLVDCNDPDCGSEPACLPPYCGDGYCDPNEDSCGCASDCGAPPGTELVCSDGLDNDCDLATDCGDTDCYADPVCISVDCSQFTRKRSCNAEPTCRWDNRNKVCVSR